MKELACQFGENKRLVGVVTEPENINMDKPIMILVNAGLLSKIGPHRLYVLMARKLAELGYVTLRFDLGGVGDSREINFSSQTLEEKKILDIETAINYMSTMYDNSGFILGGLCSGAEDSFRFAVHDKRIKGLFLIDANAYKTARSSIQYGAYRPIRKLLKVLGWYTRRKTSSGMEESSAEIGFLDPLPKKESEAKLKKLLNRHVSLKYVFTGGVYDNYNYKDQIYDMYDIERTDLIEVETYPNMGHLPLLESDKDKLVSSLAQWLLKKHN